ncbi:MAG TPA: hypothetical protein VEY07_03790 [Thermoplasmata archaeon]|nr:hypothetical protein [Thermoplasmata archaeon]
MPWRLHRGGRFRDWLGRRAGGDRATGDRLLRRVFHLAGVVVLAYYLLPPRFFVVLPTETVLVLALIAVLGVEFVRLLGGIEVPTIRDYEARRVASYAWFAVALVVAVLVFPEAVAVPVVLGTALVDPLIGELRRAGGRFARAYPAVPIAVYAGLAVVPLWVAGWGPLRSGGGALIAALIAVAVERPKISEVDDDLAMTVLPAIVLSAIGLIGPGAPLVGTWP